MNKLLKVSLNLKIFILSLIVLVSMANVLNGCELQNKKTNVNNKQNIEFDENKLLPIGSIVLLKDSDKKLMIIGRLQKQVGDEKEIEWDYSACLYPEGNLRPDSLFLFNNDVIEKVYFIGYEDEDEVKYSEKINEYRNNKK
ncbi:MULTISPECIES: DUF4176 domain-containing protein [Clostridium]|uniref:DUF4176 domain-containing protein n=1 Tax=Clostridium TaxID=1485 RepID=UPI000360574C|nr:MULTISPECIES: DUF4176 domain-containing protein [Clostridium]MBN1037090.1 DUF4176 domain-containing protein [Clostridium botulinum]MBY6810162.1 DUF4176 domain-containing protein [Clostridium botulinum]MBY6823482.1 DUF4176 domain-containing protein [Clostridium botulinum]MBY6834022.1 DUF4176 domain-containing protein [Clostridium botulinum]MBY6972369.1 DUF4176 domain-containing protein [Clostridium botulinum]